MNVEEYRIRLEEKERELLGQIARTEETAREAPDRDSPEPMDRSVSDEGEDTLLTESNSLRETLNQVRDALQRIKDGTFGKCIICGRGIEPKRLEAIPWTPYCREDQERIDREKGLAAGGPTL